MLQRYKKIIPLAAAILLAALTACAASLPVSEGTEAPTPPREEVSSQVPLPPTADEEGVAEPQPETPPTALPEAPGTVTFSADSQSAAQGGLIILRVENLPEGVLPTAVTTLDYTPTFFATEEGTAAALLPIRNRTKVGSYKVTVTAGGKTATFSIEVTDAGFHVEYIEMEQGIADSTLNNSAAADAFEELYQQMKSGEQGVYWQGEFQMPLVQETRKISSDFGDTRYVNGSLSGRHGGVDFPAPLGTPVTATSSGRVAFAGWMQQTGNTVCIEHGMGLKSWYFHMNSLSCATGDQVEKGQKIGEVGTTGASTGYHLHFAFSVGGVYVNPWLLIGSDLTIE